MAREQDAEAAGLQVEGGGVAAAGQGVQDDGHVVFAALEAVRGVYGDVGQASGRAVWPGQGRSDGGGLVAVGGADGDAVGGDGPFVADDAVYGGGAALDQAVG